MNETTFNFTSAPGVTPHAALETLEARFALRVSAALSERADDLSPDITERLRFAREKALERAKAVRVEEASAQASTVVGVGRSGAASLGGSGGLGWWRKLAMAVPVFALAAGLFMIQRTTDSTQITAAAEVDEALLSDELPPTAYSDAGFAEYLKTPDR